VTAPATAESHHPFRALRHRNYRLYFTAQLISLTGTWMQMPALLWLAYRLTEQSRWPAWIAAAQLLPTCLFGYWGGSLADRWPRRTLLFWSQAVLLLLPLILIQLVLADVTSPWPFLGVATMIGLVLAVDFPTRLSFVVDLVGKADVTNAVALNALMFNFARLLGPLLGGLVLFWAGPAACFWCNSVTYLALLTALLCMEFSEIQNGAAQTVAPPAGPGGFGHLAGNSNLLAVLVLAGLTGACGWPFLSLLPALADRALAAPGVGYNWLLSTTGLGALLAALTVAAFGSPQRSGRFIAAGVGLVCAGLAGLTIADRLWIGLACCLVTGFGLILFFSTGQATLQLGAGDRNRGQVMGVWAMVVSGAQPLGNLLVGPAADHWGEQPVLAGLAVILGFAALLIGVGIMCSRGASVMRR
jgi:MFS family permease